jgi:outer membrane lipoprotein carrier protein
LSADIQNLQSFSANFKQIVHNDQNARIVYSGKLYAKKKNNQALWIYTNPIDKKIYYSSGKVVIIEPELEQAIFAKLDKVPNLITLLTKAKKIGEHTYRTSFNNTQYTIIFKNGNLSEIDYKDELQNRIKILFSNQKVNLPISDQRFAYQIPSAYDILEQK